MLAEGAERRSYGNDTEQYAYYFISYLASLKINYNINIWCI
jgi:hypothetical protein